MHILHDSRLITARTLPHTPGVVMHRRPPGLNDPRYNREHHNYDDDDLLVLHDFDDDLLDPGHLCLSDFDEELQQGNVNPAANIDEEPTYYAMTSSGTGRISFTRHPSGSTVGSHGSGTGSGSSALHRTPIDNDVELLDIQMNEVNVRGNQQKKEGCWDKFIY